MLRMFLVAAALAQTDAAGAHSGVEEMCSCAQHEPDHPFAIDCANAAPIRAATVTLESTCKSATSYEWGGAFATPANEHKWVAQAVDGAYADPEMKLVIFDVHAADKEHLLELAETAATLMAGTCAVLNTQGTIPAPTAAGACYTLTFPTNAATDFHATVNTAGVANVAFFTAHMPTEFERDTHYFMSTDLATDIEPEVQTDAEEYNCRFHKDAGQVKVCAKAFYIIQAHHDYCPHDTLTRYEEELFHAWEGKCYGCSIVRKYDASLKNCPVIDCTDTTVAELGYEHLKETCTKADTTYPFEWAASFDTPANSYTWVSQAATDNASVASGKQYADDYMKVVAYAMTSNLKSELFGLKDDADTLMSSGACPEVTVSCTPGDTTCASVPTIIPTTAGACVTVKFPDSSGSLKDFHATVNTAGIDHVAFFTAHMPTEFERDTHYFTSMDLTTDVEPINALGESGGHGRRLSAVGRNDRRSPRRLADKGRCCDTTREQGAWKQVVAYHDECHHSQVPEYIEVGFHDYEASCEDHFCNLIGPDVDQTKCPPKVGETTYTNCGVTTTLAKTPERVVALHQGSIEFMLAMGLEDKMVGTASMDDEIWPRYKEAYDKIKILTPSGLPNETAIMAVQPDFIIGAFRSAFAEMRCDAGENCATDDSHGGIFSDATVGPCDGENSDYFPAGNASYQTSYSTCRPQLNANGIGTWLWVDYCEDPALRPVGGASEETVYEAVTQLGQIFNVPDVARQLNADIRNDFAVAEAALASSGHPALKAVWLDCMPDDMEGNGGCCRDGRPGWDPSKTIFVGGGHGGPNIIMEESGLINAFADRPDSWYCVSIDDIIAADPDVFVIVDANWDNAMKKINYLHNHTGFCGMRAVQQADYIKIQFSASNLGPRNGVAALDMVNAAIHVTTGVNTLNFNSGVDFFEKNELLTQTADLRCPLVDPAKVKLPYPMTYENCGVAHTVTESPKRVVTMNQGMTEFMLAMGLEGHMAGSAYLDDAIWPKYEAVYNAIPVLALRYATDTQLMDVKADFIMANYQSAFSEKPRSNTSNSGIFTKATVGPCEGTNSDFFPAGTNDTMSYGTCRPQLHAAGIGTWLEPTYCEDKDLKPPTATEETVYAAVTQIGQIFNVPNVATQLNAEIKNDFAVAQQTLQSTGHALTAILLDGFCGKDKNKLFVGAGQGSVNLIMKSAGFTNLFAAKEGSYACVDASEVIAANPDVLLIVEASWSPAISKIDYMHNHSELCNAKFVQQADYITIPFSASALGPRNGAAALDLVNAAIHVTTGATSMSFASGVDFFDPEVLVSRTAGLRCPVALNNIQYAGSLISPSPPPPPSGSTYTFNVIAEGVLSDFDAAKVKSIKESIASKAGVSVDDVYIQIRAASVDIVVQIKVSDYASVAKKVDSYLTSASEATELLGGDSVVTVVRVVSAPTPYPKPETDDALPAWAIGVIVLFVVLFGIVLVFATFMYLREKQGKPVFSSLEEPLPPVQVKDGRA